MGRNSTGMRASTKRVHGTGDAYRSGMSIFDRTTTESWTPTEATLRPSPAGKVPDWAQVALVGGALIVLMGALIVFMLWVISTRL
jgi:hypothetical protein